MAKNTKILLLLSIFTTGLLVACGGPKSNNERREPILSFRTTANDGSCEQPMKNFQGLEALCMYLIDEDRNDGCAQSERYDYFRTNCIVDGRPVIEDVPEIVLNPNASPVQCDPTTDDSCQAEPAQCDPETDADCETTAAECNPEISDCEGLAAQRRDTRTCEEGNQSACAVESGLSQAAPAPEALIPVDESERMAFESYNSVFVPYSEEEIIEFDNMTINGPIKIIELKIKYHSVKPANFNLDLERFRIAAASGSNVLLTLDSLSGSNISECQWEVSGNFIVDDASVDNPAELTIRGEDPYSSDYESTRALGNCEGHALNISNEVKNGSQLILVIENLEVQEIDNLIFEPFTLQIGLDESAMTGDEFDTSNAAQVGVSD